MQTLTLVVYIGEMNSTNIRKANKLRWSKMSKEDKSKFFSRAAKKRWKNVSVEDRRKIANGMVKARSKKVHA